MAHQRPRRIIEILLKRLKLWPVCGIVGMRQSGKSVMLSQMVVPKIGATYVTLDSIRTRKSASQNPEAFVTQSPDTPLVIDEIQKAPDLFDALKLAIDTHRRPGAFLISGSTEFSTKAGIRESLTGRIGVLKLFPLTLSELHPSLEFGSFYLKNTPSQSQLEITEYEKHLLRGGMPGICFLRSDYEREVAWNGWLETNAFRDLNQILRKDHDGDLALAIINELAKVQEPTASAVAKKLRRDTRVIARYLDAYTSVFVLHKLAPHKDSVGSDHYVFADSGLASYLGASEAEILRSQVLVEVLAKYEYAGFAPPHLQYFRTSRGNFIPIYLGWNRGKNSPKSIAIEIFPGEVPDKQDFRSLINFSKKYDSSPRLMLLTHTQASYQERYEGSTVEVHPLRG
jgi:predicted AAA+ superfamily ATPase